MSQHPKHIFVILQCTGVAVENIEQSQWCCFFTENLIGVKSGSNVLIHKPEVQTGCLFGFDPDTNCSQCATCTPSCLSMVLCFEVLISRNIFTFMKSISRKSVIEFLKLEHHSDIKSTHTGQRGDEI